MAGTDQRDEEAMAAAVAFNMGNALYRDIPVGGLFHFKGHPDTILRKYARGYRAADGSGPLFRTGARTAVFAVRSPDTTKDQKPD